MSCMHRSTVRGTSSRLELESRESSLNRSRVGRALLFKRTSLHTIARVCMYVCMCILCIRQSYHTTRVYSMHNMHCMYAYRECTTEYLQSDGVMGSSRSVTRKQGRTAPFCFQIRLPIRGSRHKPNASKAWRPLNRAWVRKANTMTRSNERCQLSRRRRRWDLSKFRGRFESKHSI